MPHSLSPDFLVRHGMIPTYLERKIKPQPVPERLHGARLITANPQPDRTALVVDLYDGQKSPSPLASCPNPDRPITPSPGCPRIPPFFSSLLPFCLLWRRSVVDFPWLRPVGFCPNLVLPGFCGTSVLRLHVRRHQDGLDAKSHQEVCPSSRRPCVRSRQEAGRGSRRRRREAGIPISRTGLN